MPRRDDRSTGAIWTRIARTAIAALLAAGLSGCAGAPVEGEHATGAVRAEAPTVTAMPSAADASGMRVWWLFEGDRSVTVRAHTLDEALQLGGFADDAVADIRGLFGASSSQQTLGRPTDDDHASGHAAGAVVRSSNDLTLIPIGGGGR